MRTSSLHLVFCVTAVSVSASPESLSPKHKGSSHSLWIPGWGSVEGRQAEVDCDPKRKRAQGRGAQLDVEPCPPDPQAALLPHTLWLPLSPSPQRRQASASRCPHTDASLSWELGTSRAWEASGLGSPPRWGPDLRLPWTPSSLLLPLAPWTWRTPAAPGPSSPRWLGVSETLCGRELVWI